jgi:GGDEF domain-containing protein
MISILESVSELERSHRARQTVLECYLGSLRGAARYALTLEPGISHAYRTDLESLAQELERAPDYVLSASTPRLLEIFKRFRDQSTNYVSNLQADMVKSAEALETIVRGLAENDGEQDARVRASLASVRDISDLPECATIRAALVSAAETIESSIDQIRNKYQLTVAQLKSEIRVLHKRVDRAENVVAAEDLKQLMTQGELERQILEGGGGAGSLILIKVSGLRAAEHHFGSQVAAELAGAFKKRLTSCLPESAVLARWAPEAFVATSELPGSAVMNAVKRLSETLSGMYPGEHEGKNIRLTLHVTVAVLQNEPGTEQRVLDRIRVFFAEQAPAT